MKSPKKIKSERLLPAQRIRQRGEFKLIFENGRFARGAFLKIWAYKDPATLVGAGPKLGIIISRKTHGSSVVRNLWKRRIRESFRKMQAEIKPECHILFGAKPAQKTVPDFAAMNDEIRKLLLKTESLK